IGGQGDWSRESDWRHLEKLQEEASSSFGPRGPAVESLLQMKPMVECGADIMTLRVKGGSLLYLLVDRGEASPLPLSNLPPQCGYSLRTTWRDTVFMAPYDGCYGVKEGDNYVLPLRWGGTPLKMTCPARPHVATSPSVSCHPSGMVVTIPGSGDASKLMIMCKFITKPVPLAPPFPGLPHTPHKIPWHFNLFQTPVPSHPHFYPRPPKPTPQIPIFLRPPPQMTPHPLSDPLYTPIPKPVAHHPVHGSPAHPHHTDLFYPSLPKPPVLPPVVPPPVRPVGPAVPCIFPPCPWLPVFHNHMYFNLGSHFIDCAQTHPGKPSTFPNFMLPYHSRHHNLQESSVSPRRHYDNHGPASQPFHSWDLVVPFSKPSSHMETKHRGSPPQPYNPSFYWNPAHPKPPELKQTSYPQNSEPVLDEHSGSRSAATSLSVSLGSR
uniref:Extensin-like n=1 Tax=Paramormyrops kingsleyae TaxID=1676925 RepID=A0A3B3QZV6_9TELE